MTYSQVRPIVPADKVVMEYANVEYVRPDWWYQLAKPPVLVNMCSEEKCDININDNENVSSLSYWSLPFPKKVFTEHKEFNLRKMLWKYKNYILNDSERLSHLPGLSGLRLGYQRIQTTHGHALVQLFEELKINLGDVYMWQHYCGTMPKMLRPEEMETLRRYNNDRYRHWPQYSEDVFRTKDNHRYRHPDRTHVMLPGWSRDRRWDHAPKGRYAYIPKGMQKMNYAQYVDSYMRSAYK